MGIGRTAATRAAALCLVMAGSTATADVTPGQVWEDWKAYMTGFGYAVTSRDSIDGGVLTASDIEMAMDLPDEEGRMFLSMGPIAFGDNGDGTVSVRLPETMPMRIIVESEGERVDMRLEYITRAFAMDVSGDAAAMTYAYGADEVTMALGELIVEGVPVDLGEAAVTVQDLAGTADMTRGGELRRSEYGTQTGVVSYRVDIADPEGGEGRLRAQGGVQSARMAGSASIPDGMRSDDMAAMLAAGLAVDGGFAYTGGASEYMFEEAGQSIQGRNGSDGGSIDVAMDADGLSYAVGARGLEIEVLSSDLPFPVALSMAETRFGLMMPVSQSEEVQDFGLSVLLDGFTMSDMIWALFDPEGAVPRDPATLALELAGKARLMVDLMDPEQLDKVDTGAAMPGELEALTLRDLRVSLAGAELTGAGAFSFDNADKETFQGLPAPDGKVDLTLTGANGLLDKLIGLGLVSEDEAMGARMMMGMFAVPGEGEDTLNSTIEVQPDGKVTANGQRLR